MTGGDDLLEVCRDYLRTVPRDLGYILPGELKRRLDEEPDSVFVLDNRTPEAFGAGHIAGATNIWLKDVLEPENVARLPHDRQIVVCCWVGHTASQLLAVLKILGYDAVGLKYGMGSPANPSEPRQGWTDLGLPVVVGA